MIGVAGARVMGNHNARQEHHANQLRSLTADESISSFRSFFFVRKLGIEELQPAPVSILFPCFAKKKKNTASTSIFSSQLLIQLGFWLE